MVLIVVMLVAVTYFLLPQFADLPGIVDQVKEADWLWFVPVVVGSILTYVGATFGMMGSVPERLRAVPTFVAQVATSFTGTLAPASVGGMALNVRYLQKSGVDPAIAVPAVGLNAVVGIVVHIVMLVLFIVWAGRSAFGSIHLPDPHVLLTARQRSSSSRSSPSPSPRPGAHCATGSSRCSGGRSAGSRPWYGDRPTSRC